MVGKKIRWHDIKLRYSIQSESDLEADKITAKLVSFMVLIKLDFEGAFLSQSPGDQMKGAPLFLTPEEINIIFSKDKHMIVKGPYGSGKSIIANLKAQMLANDLRENELLYYITHDSGSALSTQRPAKNEKIEIFPNEEKYKGMNLSQMITCILKKHMQRD